MKPWKLYVLLNLIVVAVLLFCADRFLHPLDLKNERAEARAAGLALSPAEWPESPVPPGKGAKGSLPDWLAVRRLTSNNRWDEATAKAVTDGAARRAVPPEQMAAARHLLAERRDMIGLVHRAAATPYLPQLNWNPAQLIPHYAAMRQGAKILRFEGDVLALDGRYTEAARANGLGLDVARQPMQDPALVPYLVSMACELISLEGMKDILSLAGPNAAACREVREAVLYKSPAYDLPRVLRGEALAWVNMNRNLGEDGRKTDPGMGYAFTDPSEAVFLHWMRRLVIASRQKPAVRAAAMDGVMKEFRATATRSPAYLITREILPVYARSGSREVQALAERAVVAAAAGVLEQKARTGAFPERLDRKLAPLPDPYTGKPLVYRREGNGFTVSSAGKLESVSKQSGRKTTKRAVFTYPPAPGR